MLQQTLGRKGFRFDFDTFDRIVQQRLMKLQAEIVIIAVGGARRIRRHLIDPCQTITHHDALLGGSQLKRFGIKIHRNQWL